MGVSEIELLGYLSQGQSKYFEKIELVLAAGGQDWSAEMADPPAVEGCRRL